MYKVNLLIVIATDQFGVIHFFFDLPRVVLSVTIFSPCLESQSPRWKEGYSWGLGRKEANCFMDSSLSEVWKSRARDGSA